MIFFYVFIYIPLKVNPKKILIQQAMNFSKFLQFFFSLIFFYFKFKQKKKKFYFYIFFQKK